MDRLEMVWQKYDAAYKALIDLLPKDMRDGCKRFSYAPGEVVVSEGDALSHIYFIETGEAEGLKRFENGKEYQYFTLDEANGAIGLLELFSHQLTIIATIIAKTRVSILRVDAAELYAHVMQDTALLRRYTYHIAKDLYNESGRNGRMFYQNGLERVCSYLADYCDKAAPRQDAVVVRQSFQSIASQIGVSTRTVGRAVRYLQQQGLCGRAGKSICVDKRQAESIRQRV